MWQKVKDVFSIIGAGLSVALFTLVLFLLRRCCSVRPGSNGTPERDNRVEEGLESGEGRTDRIEEGITKAEDGIARCEEHLQRAEEILRNAVDRGRKEDKETGNSSDGN